MTKKIDASFRPCVVVPTYNNPDTLRSVITEAHKHLSPVIVVDDGSESSGQQVARALEDEGLVILVGRAKNGGKGAAVFDGLHRARSLGYSHALQVDADGQHNLEDIPKFLEIARANPTAFVTGTPRFDASAPKSRRVGRRITQFWAAVETFGPVIKDTLCGFRVYPLEAALRADPVTRRMEFDNEIAVRMYWNGTDVINVPTQVRYFPGSGVSHYDLLWDNVLMSLMHAQLSSQALFRMLLRRGQAKRPT